ncbi:DUF397 domain-containing protein (plasmid) [Prauserella coralliicola]|nr:DUF397 domain-containing protein [Prauserella coralliicola]
MNDATYPQQPAGLAWRKSRRSQGDNDCVEVAKDPRGGRWLRDTKDRSRPAHYFTESEWSAFVGGVQDGEFD